MIDFKNCSRIVAPFPVVSKCNILPEDTFSKLIDEFPKDSDFQLGDVVMGGRKRIASDQIGFYEFLERSPAWSRLYNSINSLDAIKSILLTFSDEISEVKGDNFLENIKFDGKYFLRKARLKKILPRKIVNAFYYFLEKYSNRNQVYLHFDISEAEVGYGREIHRDTSPRVAAFLVYFNGDFDGGAGGGEFGVYEAKADISEEGFPAQPNPDDMRLVKLIAPEPNLGVLFLSLKNSYHGVPAMKSAGKKRRFIYVGISLKGEKPWYAV